MDSETMLKLNSEQHGQTYTFGTSQGLNSTNEFREEETLIADETSLGKNDQVLIIQSNYGFLGIVTAEEADKVVMHDKSSRACQYSRKNAELNEVENFEVKNKPFISEIDGSFDAVLYAPADYEPVDLVKYRLAEVNEKLKPEGRTIISGRKNSGINRYKNYLDQYGEVEKIGKKGPFKAYRAKIRDEPQRPDIEKEFSAKAAGFEADFLTGKGLFSADKLDQGTKILVENIEELEGKVLDVGCGYGAISVFLGKQYSCKIFMTDDNARAAYYAEKNMERNNLDRYNVITGDCLDGFEEERFNYIVSNPPTHQGKKVTDKIFQQSHEMLEKNGELWIVYNQNMNYQTKLGNLFRTTKVKARKDNFKVLKAKK